MKAMYNEYYKKQNRGYIDAEFKVMLEKITGTSFDDFYKKYIYDTEPLDYGKFLKYAGFELKNNTNDFAATLGIIIKQKDEAFIVSGIDRNSAAWNDGINVNDKILAINDIKVGYSVHPQKDEIDQLIARFKIGDTINVLISRDGLIKNLKVKLTDYPRFKYQMIDSKNISEKQSRIRARWLNL